MPVFFLFYLGVFPGREGYRRFSRGCCRYVRDGSLAAGTQQSGRHARSASIFWAILTQTSYGLGWGTYWIWYICSRRGETPQPSSSE
jgi:hypothetical protein